MADRFLTLDELFTIAGQDRVFRLAPNDAKLRKRAIEAAKSQAENEAVSWLLDRYGEDLPTTPALTPQVLKEKLTDAALYKLAAARQDVVPTELKDRYDAVVSWLRAVSNGRASLGLQTRPAVDVGTPALLANKSAGDMVFGNGGLDDW